MESAFRRHTLQRFLTQECVCVCVFLVLIDIWPPLCVRVWMKLSETEEPGRIGMLRRTQQAGKKYTVCTEVQTHKHRRTHTPLSVMASTLTVCVARSFEAATTRRLPGEFSLPPRCSLPPPSHISPRPNISAPTHSSPRCDSTETPPEVLAHAFSLRQWQRRCPPLPLPLPPPLQASWREGEPAARRRSIFNF